MDIESQQEKRKRELRELKELFDEGLISEEQFHRDRELLSLRFQFEQGSITEEEYAQSKRRVLGLDERRISPRRNRYPNKEKAIHSTPIKDSKLSLSKTTTFTTGNTDNQRYKSIKPYVNELNLFEEFPSFEEETINFDYLASRFETLIEEKKKKNTKQNIQKHTILKNSWKELCEEEWDTKKLCKENLDTRRSLYKTEIEKKVGGSLIDILHKKGKEILFFGDMKTKAKLQDDTYLGQMVRYANDILNQTPNRFFVYGYLKNESKFLFLKIGRSRKEIFISEEVEDITGYRILSKLYNAEASKLGLLLFEDYEVQEYLGRGACSIVFSVYHEGNKFALKTILKK